MKTLTLKEERLIREFVEILLEEQSDTYEFVRQDVKNFLKFTLITIGILSLLNPGLVAVISAELVVANGIALLDLVNFEYNHKKNEYEYSPQLFDALLNLGGIGVIKFLSVLKQKNMLEKITLYTKGPDSTDAYVIERSFNSFYNLITRTITSGIMAYDFIDTVSQLKAEVIKKFPELENDEEINTIFQEYTNVMSVVSNNKQLTDKELNNISTLKQNLLSVADSFKMKEKIIQKVPEQKEEIAKEIIASKPKNSDKSWDWPDWIKQIFKPMKHKMKPKNANFRNKFHQ